jgi:CubicO group peptidase (beta-lactamase class C family)
MRQPSRLIFLVAAVVHLWAASACGPTPSGESGEAEAHVGLGSGMPEDVGMSVPILRAAVDTYRRAVDAERLTGAQLLVARRGAVVIHEAVGFRDLERKLPMETSTLVRLASNTKSVVATGILMLVDDGLLSLEDRVAAHIPGFSEGLAAQLTVRDLLRHTTGFDNQLDNYVGQITLQAEEFPDAPSLRVEAIKIGQVGPSQPPGEEFLYNNWGYTVLGAIIEEVSGEQLEEFLSRRLYVPLGMSDTSHAWYGVDPGRVAINYRGTEDGWKEVPPETPPFARATGGLVSTAWDFAKFCQLFLNGGRYGNLQLLTPEIIKQATSLQARGPYQYAVPGLLEARGIRPAWYNERDSRGRGLDVGYGYGWAISRDGAYSHAGFRGTFAFVDPAEDLIILVFGQSREGRTPGQAFIDLVYDAIRD